MRYGVITPNFGDYFDSRRLAELAYEAEAAGWDGFFIWDHILLSAKRMSAPMADPWVALAAMAMRTTRIRLGPMVTPVARRRPWKLARETVSLDHLSDGRLILGVGLGYPPEVEFAMFGEDADDRVRAQKLDEGLDVLTGLWGGAPFRFDGAHYRVAESTFLPCPVQSPRVPIWVAGMWPNKPPFRRAARWDGVFPLKVGFPAEQLTPGDVRDMLAYIKRHRRTDTAFDVVLGGITPDATQGTAIVAPYAEAGVTWWLEALDPWRGPLDAMRQRIHQGPPKL